MKNNILAKKLASKKKNEQAASNEEVQSRQLMAALGKTYRGT
jgi:hypothetical protein